MNVLILIDSVILLSRRKIFALMSHVLLTIAMNSLLFLAVFFSASAAFCNKSILSHKRRKFNFSV